MDTAELQDLRLTLVERVIEAWDAYEETVYGVADFADYFATTTTCDNLLGEGADRCGEIRAIYNDTFVNRPDEVNKRIRESPVRQVMRGLYEALCSAEGWIEPADNRVQEACRVLASDLRAR